MRKSRFMVNLMVATALGLASIGCGQGSNTAAIQATDDIRISSGQGGSQDQREQSFLREYLIVGQRGLDVFSPAYTADQGDPADATRPVIAQPGDSDSGEPALLFEAVGIATKPNPNFNLLGPGQADPTSPEMPAGSTGYHGVYADPNGNFVVGISRAKDRAFSEDSVRQSTLQIYAIEPEAAFDVAFPPVYVFEPPARLVSIFNFAPDQGEFVSGMWSPDGKNFYASISNNILVHSVDGLIGDLRIIETLPFPAGGAGINNAVKLVGTNDGQNVYALDNANGSILHFARAADGTLTQVSATPTVGDPRGAVIDRSNGFLYVVGRSSSSMAGYSIGADGSLTQIELFAGFGAVNTDLGQRLGSIAANSQADRVYVGSFNGVVQAYQVDTATGALLAQGSVTSLGNSRNIANMEVDPTGNFVVVASEHDLDSFAPEIAAGLPIFANIDTATNGEGGPVFSPTPMFDELGRVVFVQPIQDANVFEGDVQVYRSLDGGQMDNIDQVPVVNPYGLTFFQKVIEPPGSSDPSAGSNDVDNAGLD